MNKEYKQMGQLIQELKDTGKVRFTDAEYRYYSESISDVILKKLKEIKFDNSILSFYRELDFIKINWFLIENSGLNFIDEEVDIVGGGLNIPTFSYLVEILEKQKNQSIIDPDKTLKYADYQSLKNYIPFDILNGEGVVCFKIINKKVVNDLYFISVGLETFIKPLKVNWQEYLDKGYKFYFFYQWQKACFFDDQKIKKEIDFYLLQLKNR